MGEEVRRTGEPSAGDGDAGPWRCRAGEGSAPDASARTGTRRLRLVYFGPDATHATVRKRIHAFQHAGADVKAFTFRRTKINADFQPDWPNTPLGETRDRSYLARLGAILGAVAKLGLRHREELRGRDVFYARNFDMLGIAVAARALSGARARVVYEVPDIQRFFFRRGAFGRLMRGAERALLRRTDLIVCSSPAFMRYFRRVQDYRGRHFVWENRVLASEMPSGRVPARPPEPPPAPPWIIGWFGTLRCVRSIELLSGLARELPHGVEIHTRGVPTETGLDGFRAIVGDLPNFRHAGEYRSPDDLASIYGGVHFTWCLDFHDADGNSRLLLPNRLYQGGLYGTVMLGHEEQETGRYIEREDIGFNLGEPVLDQAIELFRNLRWEDYLRKRENVLNIRDRFVDDGSDTRKLLRALEALGGG